MIIKKDILILVKGPTQGLHDNTLTIEGQYSITFSKSNRKFYLSLHYNGSKSFLLVGATKIYQFRAKDSELKIYSFCLENISGDLSAIKKKKTGLNGCM